VLALEPGAGGAQRMFAGASPPLVLPIWKAGLETPPSPMNDGFFWPNCRFGRVNERTFQLPRVSQRGRAYPHSPGPTAMQVINMLGINQDFLSPPPALQTP